MDEKTAKVLSNYSESKTCDKCANFGNNECAKFDIDVPDDFTCLGFKGEEDGI